MKNSKSNAESLEDQYRKRHDLALVPIAAALQEHIVDCFKGQPRIDRISARAKGISSFLEKAKKVEGGKKKYREPLSQIQDQIGCRIVTFFASDVERIDAVVRKYFRAIEFKDLVPESESEFGYFGRHFVLLIPYDVVDPTIDRTMVPTFFELQIKTLFQHAWAEAEHDLGYKVGQHPLSSEQKRRLAFTAAQAWGADQIFDELFRARKNPKSAPRASE
jgi:ppGpp synthetase/RelA/SpoT-type nucleotidyltranferase